MLEKEQCARKGLCAVEILSLFGIRTMPSQLLCFDVSVA